MSRSVREERAAFRRPTNLSLDAAMVTEAQALGINISRACEEGLAKQISIAKAERWQEENRGAIDGYNAWIEKHGLPLAEHRMF